MSNSERFREERNQQTPPSAPGGAPAGNTDALRQQAARVAAVGDTAIRRALSFDSQAFLKATKQQGGE